MNKQEALAILHQDFLAFTEQCFVTLEHADFDPNWHIEALCYQLVEMLEGKEPRLVINMPPRYLKSLVVSVALPAWVLGHTPGQRIICASYSDDLAKKFMREFRMIIESDWYRELFPNMIIGAKNTETEIVTTQNGGRVSTSIGGTLTGKGGDLIVVDDPHKAEDAQSDARRKQVNDWFDNTLFTRLNHKKRSQCIVVMQRLHEDDLSGHLLAKGIFNSLVIPAIAETAETYALSKYKTYTRKAGEALHPTREDLDTLAHIKQTIGSSNFLAQYQQTPVPPDGNMFKRDWLRYYEQFEANEGGLFFWSWDTAAAKSETADYSVGTYWYASKQGYYLLDLVRHKFDFNELRSTILNRARSGQCDAVLVERSPCSIGLGQSLQHQGINIISIPVKTSKEARAMQHTASFEAGRIYFPKNAAWLGELERELLAFPNSKHDDQVDSITQALAWADHKMQPHHQGVLRVQFLDLGAGKYGSSSSHMQKIKEAEYHRY